MDCQSKESRIKQLRMWQKESKKALKVLVPIKDLLDNFRDTHLMHVHHLSETIDELNMAIERTQELYNTSTEELGETL